LRRTTHYEDEWRVKKSQRAPHRTDTGGTLGLADHVGRHCHRCSCDHSPRGHSQPHASTRTGQI